MKSNNVTFTNKENNTISAKLELPLDNKPEAYVIFAHCFTCSKNLSAVVNISRALAQHGFGVLRFDFTGLGESEGEFSDTNFTSNTTDLIAAYTFLETNYKAPELVIGHSLGGAAVLAAAHNFKATKGVVTIGSPYDPAHLKKLFKAKSDIIENEGEATVDIGGRAFKIKKQLIEDLEEASSEERISQLNKSLLIFHSPQDQVVDISNAKEIYLVARHPKSFISLDKADHLLSNKLDSTYVGNTIAAWAERYVEEEDADELNTDLQAVVMTGEQGYTTEIKAAGHSLIADEPESVGGLNLGPNPYDLLVSSLGACTSMTLRMYADRKNIDLKEVKVHLKHDKVHSSDCESCETKPVLIDQIERYIELSGNLTEEEKAKLLEIADKCPVHRTLHNEIVVKTSLM
ncbi:bifunctional alpha/beta hydrolase/OsmC family protein [Fulvivirga lutimaris]|uniref:bifunctional alpha/beta hydrolase/OsmC family protein n=1 Tax=Fulvivirga lutimaris TaxID=1819566 RepID=UPI0012BCFAFA|nr:alpha/beta fold hydrolase [Fulvivirga lutimaris]MTI41374.1 alpha/beta fold hydrolase [Fulvivirga lutimaris]